jgi:hypothetical protein
LVWRREVDDARTWSDATLAMGGLDPRQGRLERVVADVLASDLTPVAATNRAGGLAEAAPQARDAVERLVVEPAAARRAPRRLP